MNRRSPEQHTQGSTCSTNGWANGARSGEKGAASPTESCVGRQKLTKGHKLYGAYTWTAKIWPTTARARTQAMSLADMARGNKQAPAKF